MIASAFSRPGDPDGPVGTIPAGSAGAIYFNGGTPMSHDALLVTDNAALPTAFLGGLGYTDAGALCCSVGGAIFARAPGGAPIGRNGRLCVSVGQPIASYLNGIGIDAAGRVCVTA